MRLTTEEVAAIKAAAREAFGDTAVVRLFGSRVDDGLKGGDIDLHFEVDEVPEPRSLYNFLDRVDVATDGRRVDTVFSRRCVQPRGIERIAYRDGIIL